MAQGGVVSGGELGKSLDQVVVVGRELSGEAAGCDAERHGMRYHAERGSDHIGIFSYSGRASDVLCHPSRHPCRLGWPHHSLNVFQVVLERDQRGIKLRHGPSAAEIS
jgi:hypothetical protein